MHYLLHCLTLFIVFCTLTCACAPSGARSVYPAPDILRMAEPQRHEFVQLFLQGRWCEARSMFERSTESYLMQDDFCSAAQNNIVAWKLKQYIGISDPQLLEKAGLLLQTGMDCPDAILPDQGAEGSPPDTVTQKDRGYRELLDDGRFDLLSARLRAERDQLYASVYGRKAARAASIAGQLEQAEQLVRQTRSLDARQGWIVFLIQDWKMLYALTQDQAAKVEIQERIEQLQDLLQPCPF
ncbi:MAG TPA: hypothetical protein ENN39_02505 [Desulfonatronum sp.]|nr:hypothetical protein [Desulfonatronum sp.]